MSNGEYGTVRLDVLRDRRLKLETKGLYSVLAQLPDDWTFSLDKLAGYVNTSKILISKLLCELVSAGYGVMETDMSGNIVFFKLCKGTEIGIKDIIPVSNNNQDDIVGLFESMYGIMRSGERRALTELRSRYGDKSVRMALERAGRERLQRNRVMIYVEDCGEAVVMDRPVPVARGAMPKPRFHNDCQAAADFLDMMYERGAL